MFLIECHCVKIRWEMMERERKREGKQGIEGHPKDTLPFLSDNGLPSSNSSGNSDWRLTRRTALLLEGLIAPPPALNHPLFCLKREDIDSCVCVCVPVRLSHVVFHFVQKKSSVSLRPRSPVLFLPRFLSLSLSLLFVVVGPRVEGVLRYILQSCSAKQSEQ